ncbi:MAG TPA: TonB-dependent receptor [Candidatus Polarisedimenticolia bacterium]|jgi:outer membrane receptor protein involved in Fe transport|nr:TonB-dependent receptor [Candidatus Polarisedimenticolia bacterium]
MDGTPQLRNPLRPAAILLLVLACWGAAEAPAAAQGPIFGVVRGTVTDKDFGVTLAGVRVTIMEAFLATQTGPDGSFVFERVPPGTYTLAFTKDGYQRKVAADIVVNAGTMAEVRTELSIEVTEMDEMVVTGEDILGGTEVGLLDIRSEATTVQDAISSEIMSKSGATDVAGALKFVVGASVTGGKYAVVRGLSDRYTGTTLNGVKIPSADPRRRAVQVDLFPTGTIESVTVTKTFTPDLQGDFTGGGIDIVTKGVPDEKLYSAGFGLEYNSLATGNDRFLTYEGGGVTTLGIAGDDRALPEEAKTKNLPPPSTFPPNQGSYSANATRIANAQMWSDLTRSFQPVMGVSREAPGPNTSFSVVGGNRFDQGEGSAVGVVGALTYTHKYDFYEGGQNNLVEVSDPSQPLTLGQTRFDSAGLDEVLVGVLGSFVYQVSENHEMGLRLIGNQSAEDEARFQTNGDDPIQINQSLHYTERTVGSGQFYGKHHWTDAAWKGVKLDWFATYNTTRQDEPDVRFFLYNFSPATQAGAFLKDTNDADRSRRIFRNIEEAGPQGAVNLVLPFDQWTASEGNIKAGLFYDSTDRDFTQNSFTYHFQTQASSSSNAAQRLNTTYATFTATEQGQLWTDIFTDPERIGFAEVRCPPDKTRCTATDTNPSPYSPRDQLVWFIDPLDDLDVDYTGDQSAEAGYGMVDLPLVPSLNLVAGARYEKTKMSVVPTGLKLETIQQDANGNHAIVPATQEEASAHIDDADLLPSVGMIYAIRPEMKLRASWSRTIARPNFRELAPVATEEFLAGDEFVGNVDLVLSHITNYDLRWEWFRKPGEVLAASVFHKDITDPIELISFATAGRNFVQPVNYEQGELKGFELEARYPLGGFAKVMEGWTIGTNYTSLDSSVDVPLIEQQSLANFGLNEEQRRLQGQPDHIFNASIAYDNDRLGIQSGLFYNVTGETLLTGAAAAETGGVPNTFGETFRTVDFTYSQKIVRGKVDVSFTLKAKNFMEPQRTSVYRTPDDQEVIKTLRDTAALYGLSFNLKW